MESGVNSLPEEQGNKDVKKRPRRGKGRKEKMRHKINKLLQESRSRLLARQNTDLKRLYTLLSCVMTVLLYLLIIVNCIDEGKKENTFFRLFFSASSFVSNKFISTGTKWC